MLAAAEPDDLDGSLLLGLALGGLCGQAISGANDDPAEARSGLLAARSATLLVQVGRARPLHAHPCTDLLGLLQAARAQDGYEPVLRAALRLEPGDLRLVRAWAELLHDSGRDEEALAAAKQWLTLCRGTGTSDLTASSGTPDPQAASGAQVSGAAGQAGEENARALLAAILVELGRGEAALELCQALVAQSPGTARHWANLGTTLRRLGRGPEAMPAFARAAALAPGEPQIRLNHAVALLQAGRLAEGWREYEARLALPGHTPLPAARLLPDLAALGPAGLRGRVVLCTHEEGFGDTLQFSRYLPMLAARGARVLALVPQPLVRLLRTLDGVEVVEQGMGALPAHDWHCPMLSLPRAFATTLATIPWPGPYLRPTGPAGSSARSSAPGLGVPRLEPGTPAAGLSAAGSLRPGTLQVGLVWAGQARPWQPGFATIDRRRSLPLAALAPLAAVPGIRLVGLQQGAAAHEARSVGFAVEDGVGGAQDFADTAGVVAGLDAVVCVDTAVAHLAGALGRPVLLLDRFDACWRWLDGRTDSPWYPQMRILRQERPGEWTGAVARAAAALHGLARG